MHSLIYSIASTVYWDIEAIIDNEYTLMYRDMYNIWAIGNATKALEKAYSQL